jgi:hypothetical protein
MNDNKLTDLQHVILLLVRCGRDHEMNPKWIKQIESLEKIGLIQLKPNTKNEWMLTLKGEDCMVKDILIKYPLHTKGDTGSYNKVLATMDDSALNALVCAMTNEECFSRIDEKIARTFSQKLLDIEFYKKWGPVLIEKWFKQMESSRLFFTNMNKKYGKTSSTSHEVKEG